MPEMASQPWANRRESAACPTHIKKVVTMFVEWVPPEEA
jgi:hypothetical protein